MDRKKIILLVEDNPDDEKLTLRAMKKNNILNDIVVVRDGAEAVDYLFGAEKYKQPQACDVPLVILLDLNLPKIGGLEVLRQIKGNDRTCLFPVVILTSSREERDLVKSYKLGANSYICKPVDFNQFSEAIRQLGIYWLTLNQVPATNS
jgi:two-component system response regulator